MKRNFTIALLVLFLVGCNSSTATSNNTTTTKVEDYKTTITANFSGEKQKIKGKFTGNLLDGKPEGKGKFVSKSDDDTKITYNGNFKNGYFNGYGELELTIDDETRTIAGTYIKGDFKPTLRETYDNIGWFAQFGEFSVPDKVLDYIDDNQNMFPTTAKETVEAQPLQGFSIKQFNKTRKQDEIGLVKLNLQAIQVFEDEIFDEKKLTSILAMDNEENYYAFYYLDSVEVYDDDYFTAYAIPCDTSSFDNVSGGTTNVVVLLTNYIE